MKRAQLLEQVQPIVAKFASAITDLAYAYAKRHADSARSTALEIMRSAFEAEDAPPPIVKSPAPKLARRAARNVAKPKTPAVIERDVKPQNVAPAKRGRTCGKCGGTGHNARTCLGDRTAEVDDSVKLGAGADHDRREKIAQHLSRGRAPRTAAIAKVEHIASDEEEEPARVRPPSEIIDAIANDDPQPAEPTSKRRRRARGDRPRPHTIAAKHMTRREARVINADLAPELARIDEERPKTRADCKDGPRPCPWVGCKHHLALDINHETGSIKLNHPDREVWELADTCALDVAERGEQTLESIGALMNLTRERVRQIEVPALHLMKSNRIIREIDDDASPDNEENAA